MRYSRTPSLAGLHAPDRAGERCDWCERHVKSFLRFLQDDEKSAVSTLLSVVERCFECPSGMVVRCPSPASRSGRPTKTCGFPRRSVELPRVGEVTGSAEATRLRITQNYGAVSSIILRANEDRREAIQNSCLPHCNDRLRFTIPLRVRLSTSWSFGPSGCNIDASRWTRSAVKRRRRVRRSNDPGGAEQAWPLRIGGVNRLLGAEHDHTAVRGDIRHGIAKIAEVGCRG